MKIIRVSHGLANQMLQYIFYKYIEVTTGDECYLDDSFFLSPDVPHNGLEIDKIFNIKPPWLRERFSAEAWERMSLEIRNNTLHNYAASLGIQINVIADEHARYLAVPTPESKYREHKEIYNVQYYETVPYTFDARIVDFSGHCYYAGAWVTDMFFKAIPDIILKDFQFPEFDEKNQKTADDISGCTSVGVHVRRGNFVEGGRGIHPERYTRPVDIIRRSVRNPVFFIFSDDIEWCKENIEKMSFTPSDEIVFVEGNTGMESYRDMQLMTYCKHLIRAPGSTFSFMADILSRNPHRITIPRKYFY